MRVVIYVKGIDSGGPAFRLTRFTETPDAPCLMSAGSLTHRCDVPSNV
jgi:hypothetical protein